MLMAIGNGRNKNYPESNTRAPCEERVLSVCIFIVIFEVMNI
jgi:hypothetical protein